MVVLPARSIVMTSSALPSSRVSRTRFRISGDGLVGCAGLIRGLRVVIVDNWGPCSVNVLVGIVFRSDLMLVAERASSGVWKNTHAGGLISASRRAAVIEMRHRANRCAAAPESAFKE